MASGPITSWQMLFSPAGMSNSLWPHGLQHTRISWPSPSPGACSNSCPLSQWCHPTIPSFAIPFFSCIQPFPASGTFPVSRLFPSGGQVLELQLQQQSFWWIFRTDLLAVQGTLNSFLQHHSSKASIPQRSAFIMVQLSHPYMTTGKTIALTRWTFVGKVMFLLFNMLSRLVIAFLPRSKRLLISWLQSPSAVILEPEKIKSVTVFTTISPSICLEVMRPDAIILVFWMLSFKPTFHSPLSLSSRVSLVLCFLP